MRTTTVAAHPMAGAMALALLLVAVPRTARAQDPVKVAPHHFKVLLENERVRVLDFTSTAGQKVPMHSHPAYISYSLSGKGKTRFTSPDGKTSEEPTAGGASWHEAATHASEYLGPGATHVLLIELKGGE